MKPTRIITVRDVRLAKLNAEAAREAAANRRMLRAKVRRWEAKVARYGGDVHIATLEKFRRLLAEAS